MPATQEHPTELDTRTEPSPARIRASQIIADLIPYFGVLAIMIALPIPIHALQPIAEVFAGEDTNISMTLATSFSLTAVTGSGWGVSYLRGRKRTTELKRVRATNRHLQRELGLRTPGDEV